MKITKQARREAKELFRSAFVNGVMDEGKVRAAVQRVVENKPRKYVAILEHFKRLVKLEGNRHYSINGGVAFPYARPAVRTFIQNLAAEFYVATGERLVVTSLTRPISRQPRNASELSVHPAGMAVDLRVPRKTSSRKWLERRLLQLEDQVVLDATKERKPAHYHVAVFPREYEKYIASLGPKS